MSFAEAGHAVSSRRSDRRRRAIGASWAILESIMTAAPRPQTPTRCFKYYDLLMAAFVTVLLCANLIGASKVCQVHGYTFGAGVLFFPISYLFGDVLTEVYGYARARKVVWSGFAALIFASFMSWAVLAFPPAPGWAHQAAFEMVFANTPRIVLASLIAYFCGEFCNSYVLAKMKIRTRGRFLWMRTIGSTIVGEGVDSLVFYPLAFLRAPGWTDQLVLQVLVGNYFAKVAWETVATPLTYRIVNFLKRAESEDYFDRDTQFTPFSLET
jgi:queuosine precursor transporter